MIALFRNRKNGRKYRYVLDGFAYGDRIRFFVTYASRAAAERKLGRVLDEYGLQVREDFWPQKHVEEFLCDRGGFTISRKAV